MDVPWDGDWYGDTCHVFQNPKNILPAPTARYLPRGRLLFATSGTSGRPKWVAHTRASILAAAAGVNHHISGLANDRWLLALPTFHLGGLAILARAALSGASVHSFAEKWNPQRFVEVVTGEAVTLSSLVPTQVHDLVAQARLQSPPSLRAVFVGGGALSPRLYEQARQLGWPLLPTYGSTEAASQIATASLATLSQPISPNLPPMTVLPQWEAQLETRGLLEIRGPALFHGYCLPDGEAWQWEFPFRDDWFACADHVSLADGCVRWLARADRVVKLLGELVNLDALEQTLSELCGQETLVLATPHERTGQSLHVISEAFPKMGWAGLLEAFHATQPPYIRISLANTHCHPFPRSPLGKVQRAALQKDLLGGMPET
jgi:o-succinylbenzoate---CoA ligase